MSDTCGFCEVHDCWHGAPGEEARGERHAVAAYLRRYAKEERKHAQALRADAGTQAEPEARAVGTGDEPTTTDMRVVR